MRSSRLHSRTPRSAALWCLFFCMTQGLFWSWEDPLCRSILMPSPGKGWWGSAPLASETCPPSQNCTHSSPWEPKPALGCSAVVSHPKREVNPVSKGLPGVGRASPVTGNRIPAWERQEESNNQFILSAYVAAPLFDRISASVCI